MLIGFSQTAGDARAFAAKHRYQIDVDQECLAQSAANIGAGVFHGMPVSTSLSASSLNDHSGARSGLASITSGVTVLLTLLVLAPLFSSLPKPVLGALIIEAVVMGMMNLPEMRRMYAVKRFDFWIAVAAMVGTLAFGVLSGVVIGIGLSMLWLVGVATQPQMPILGREPGTQVFRDVLDNPDDDLIPEVIVVRLDGGLFFATADALEDRIRTLIKDAPDARGVVLDCEGINFLDSQGSATVDDIHALCEQADVTLRLARVKPAVREVLERDGTIGRIGRDHLHGNVHRAVESQLGR
jgi:anti-anti-sigma factor